MKCRTWLLLDANWMMWRAFHTIGHLSHAGAATGATFGFFKTLHDLKQRFMTELVVHCFDHGRGLRYTAFPDYKSSRKKQEAKEPEDKRRAKLRLRKQIEALKLKHLRRVGYRNVFFQEGYEADDVIAAVVPAVRARGDRAVIVSGDRDLYQLLSHDRVILWNPQTQLTVTERAFTKKYGVTVQAWRYVKALGGCGGDDVKGVPGVAEKTALKYLTGQIPKAHAIYKLIRSAGAKKVVRRNLPAVTLPYPGCKSFALVKDRPDPEAWAAFCEELGFASLAGAGRPRGFKLGAE